MIILGFWWRILGELHHWRLTQVQITSNLRSIFGKNTYHISCDVRNKRNFDSWMERLATRFPKAHEENTPKVRLTPAKQSDRLYLGVHRHRGDGEWHSGRDLWAVQVSIIDQLCHLHFNLWTPLLQRQIETSPGVTKSGDQLKQWRHFPIDCRRDAIQVENLIQIITQTNNSIGGRQDDVPQYSSRPSSSLALHSLTPRYLQTRMKEHLTSFSIIHAFTTRSRSPASRRPHSTLPPNVPEHSLPPR